MSGALHWGPLFLTTNQKTITFYSLIHYPSNVGCSGPSFQRHWVIHWWDCRSPFFQLAYKHNFWFWGFILLYVRVKNIIETCPLDLSSVKNNIYIKSNSSCIQEYFPKTFLCTSLYIRWTWIDVIDYSSLLDQIGFNIFIIFYSFGTWFFSNYFTVLYNFIMVFNFL